MEDIYRVKIVAEGDLVDLKWRDLLVSHQTLRRIIRYIEKHPPAADTPPQP